MASPASSHSVLSAAVRLAASSSSPACILDGRGAYLFANDAWLAVIADRGTLRPEAVVGAAFLEHVEGDDLRQAWSEALRDVLSGTAPSRTIAGEHNTPTLARLTATRVEPIASAHGVLGLALARTVVRERPISELYVVSDRPDGAYAHEDGRVVQCPCCRRVRDRVEPASWEVVPRWIAAPPPSALGTTCDLCAELHLGLLREFD
jgi:hypothetical protein